MVCLHLDIKKHEIMIKSKVMLNESSVFNFIMKATANC